MNAIRRRWAERPRLSPRVGVVLVGLWLGMSGNLALWRALSALPEMTGGRGAGLVATLAMLSAMASVVLLVPLAWVVKSSAQYSNLGNRHVTSCKKSG